MNFKQKRPEHYALIRERIKSGYYKSDEALMKVAIKLSKDLEKLKKEGLG